MFKRYEIIDLEDYGSVLIIYVSSLELAEQYIEELTSILPEYEIECDELIDDSYSIKVFF